MKRKLFKFTQMSFAILGIKSQKSAKKYPFNGKILAVLLLYSFMCISHVIYLIQAVGSANSFAEYTDSIFGTAASISVAIYFAITVYNTSVLFKYIYYCGKSMEKSELIQFILEHAYTKRQVKLVLLGSSNAKLTALYNELNRKTEKCSKIIYFITTKLSPICIIVPKSIICFFVYFTTNLAADAFELPLPMWSV